MFINQANAIDQFNFNVTEAEILDDGNIFKGTKGGTATSSEGLTISADNFEYNKKTNILNSSGNVKIEIYKKYKLKDAVQAHKDLEGRKITGPAVIIP